MKSISIYISYHDEHPIINSSILKPIQTGCKLANRRFKRMLGDDYGDNISEKNAKYCELTAQYCIWKNYMHFGNPDYVGFMHYRRHFIFDDWKGNPNWVWLPKGDVYFVSKISMDYLKHISDQKIMMSIDNTDCIVITPYDVKNIDSNDIRTQFCKLPKQQGVVFDIFIEILKELYPSYRNEIRMIEKGSIQYLCNMFIMRKDLFFEYSEFCFSVLDAVDKKVDTADWDEQASRFLGYLGEFLLSIYIFHLKSKGNITIKELSATYVLGENDSKYSLYNYWKYKIFRHLFGGKRGARHERKYQYYRLLKEQSKIK